MSTPEHAATRCGISVCCRLLFTASLIFAAVLEASETILYHFPTTYVSATRLPPELAAPGRRVVVLDSTAIARSGASSLADLLQILPGVHLRTRGPFGAQADLEISGSTFSQALVLVDGMRVNDPQTGHHNLNLPLRPEDLERIELLYGAGSSVHGPDAFGGVVNLVPRRTPLRQLQLATHWGRPRAEEDPLPDDDAFGSRTALRYGWQLPRGTLALTAGRERSNGYRRGTDSSIDRLAASGRIPLPHGRLDLLAGVEDKAFGARDFYAPYPSREWTRAWLGGIHLQRTFASGDRLLTTRLYYRRHRDRFVLTAADPSLYENRHLSRQIAFESHLSLPLGGNGRWLFGGEMTRQTLTSSNLGDRSRYRSGLFAECGFGGIAWQSHPGIRLDHSTGYGWQLSPSFDLSRTWIKTQIFASVGRAFRAPSFTELYYRDPANIGDSQLEAERAWTFETGFRYHPFARLRLETALFSRFEENLIDYTRPTDRPPWMAGNLGSVRSLGAQNSLHAQLRRDLGIALHHTWLHRDRRLPAGIESKYAFTHPRQLVQLDLDHGLPTAFHLEWHFSWRESARNDDYLLADLALSRSLSYGRFLARIANLTDTSYEELPGLPMPGRWFTLETILDL